MKRGILKYILILLVAVSLVSGLIYNSRVRQEQIAQDIAVNRQKVKTLEGRDIAKTEEHLRKIRKEYGINRSEIDSMSNKRYFEDSVFMGDSLMEPLSLYDHLPPSNVIAKMGRNTTTASEDVPLLSSVSPGRIFMMYGMNDLTTKDSAASFKKSYEELIAEVQKTRPDAKIILLSILPVTPAAASNQPQLKDERIDEFNSSIREIAEEKGFIYMDVQKLVRENDLYEPDGIHLKSEFYTKFLNHIKTEFMTEL